MQSFLFESWSDFFQSLCWVARVCARLRATDASRGDPCLQHQPQEALNPSVLRERRKNSRRSSCNINGYEFCTVSGQWKSICLHLCRVWFIKICLSIQKWETFGRSESLPGKLAYIHEETICGNYKEISGQQEQWACHSTASRRDREIQGRKQPAAQLSCATLSNYVNLNYTEAPRSSKVK